METTNTFDVMTQQQAEAALGQAPASTKSDPEAEFTNRIFESIKSGSQVWRDQMIEDWDFFLGAQTSDKANKLNKKRKQKSYNVDVIFQAVEQAVALLTSNKPRFTCTGTEDSDTRIAGVFSAIMQQVWHLNNATQKLKQVIKDYYVGSVGWFHIWWNPYALNGKGDIAIDTIDPKRVYTDLDSKDFFWEDANHKIVETYLTSEMMQVTYNMTLEELREFETCSVTNESSTRVSEHDSGSANMVTGSNPMYRRLDRYSKVKEFMIILEKEDERFEMIIDPEQFVQRINNMPCIIFSTSKAVNYFVNPRNVSNVSKLLSQYGEVFHEIQTEDPNNPGQQIPGLMSGIENQVEYPPGTVPIPNSTTYLKLVTMREAIMKGEVKTRKALLDRVKHVASIGNKVLFSNIIPSEHHVLIPLINNFDRTVIPVGDVRRVKREQEFINDIRRLVVTHAGLMTNYKIAYPEGMFKEDDLNARFADPTKRFIVYTAEGGGPGITVIAPPPLPNHLYELEQQARRNIEERLGIFALMQGNPNDAPNTYKGTVALDEYGQRRIKSKKDDIEDFLNQVGKVVVDFIQYYYTDNRVINIITPNDKPMTISLRNDSRMDNLYEGNEFRINDITVGQFDLVVVSGSTLPSNRWAQAEMAREDYKLGLVDQESTLRKMEYPDVDMILERVGIINQLKSMLAQAQDTIKKLSGDQQTMERELMHAKRDKDMALFQTELDKQQTHAAAARMVYENTLKMLRKANIGTN
jgi:hypothetical protein